MKTTASALTFILALSILLVIGVQPVTAPYTSDGQAFILVSPISIISPSNSTYTPQSLTLNFTVKSFLDSSKANITIVYSIDGKTNKTIDTQSTPVPMGIQSYYLITGWATLPEMSEGSHSITVYGKYEFPMSYHNIGLDNRTVYFTISTNSEQEIPEFPSWTPLLITLVAVVAVAVMYRQKMSKSDKRGGNH